jgi:hypothetical protein
MKQKIANRELWEEVKSTPAIWLTGLILLAGLFYFSDEILDNLFPLRHSPDFETVKINSKVKQVLYYNKGYPVVTLFDGRTLLLEIIGVAGKKYVQAGDSIVKLARTDSVTVYRRYPAYMEVCLFGEGKDYGQTDLDYPYSGLLKRERIAVEKE